ncbi:MAG: bifunctional diguanylate cyclase/phosphodiesterase [Eubacteriales bacterium]
MELLNYLKMLTNDCSNLCYFADFETDELLFLNQAMERKFQIFEDYIGKTVHDILGGFLPLCGVTTKEKVEQGEIEQETIYSEHLKIYLHTHTSVLEIKGRKLLFVKYFLTNFVMEQVGTNQSFDEALTDCLEILSIPDKAESIKALLALLGEFYECSATYVYEFDRNKLVLSNSLIWYADGKVGEQPDENNAASLSDFLTWAEMDRDMITIDSHEKLGIEGSNEQKFFSRYNISNIILNKLWNAKGELIGVVGMTNRTNTLIDERLLKTISIFIVERIHEISITRSMKTLSETDLLTGFYNRTKYAEKLSEIHQNRPKSLGVLFVNLNGLRKTNEYLGFEVGDAQIKKTSGILREFFRGDFYRISGDEFVGFSADCTKGEFEDCVNKLQQRLKEENHESSFSVGHSWANGTYSVSELIKKADTVMVINKQAFYSATFQENKAVANSILQDLFQAIAEDEFLVYLQPQIDLETEKVVGAEALIRRFDKKHQKMIFPDQFIPFYEQNSVIRHVDLFVVRKACLILLEWIHCEHEMPISVNLSRVTLTEHGIVDTISDILDEYNVPHHLIIIEVTERIGLVENEVASTLVDEFKSRGFRLSLDDFGCAYSNIVTLATISVDEVKIDKSLVDNVLTNAKNSVIVKNMLAMCLELEGTHTLAEGIETQEQAEFLRSVKCQLGQGYLYSRPIPNEEFFQKYIKD